MQTTLLPACVERDGYDDPEMHMGELSMVKGSRIWLAGTTFASPRRREELEFEGQKK